MKKTDNVYDYYRKEFPTDDLGSSINNAITFSNVINGMRKGGDIYDIIGVGDSIVRERVMTVLADLYHKGDYDYVYNLWLYGIEKKRLSKDEKEVASKEITDRLYKKRLG